MKDKNLRLKLAVNARKQVENNFTLNQAVNKIKNLL